jgi:protein-S-isoprenylcysteine O-methyltransferase Ste14
VDRKVIARYTVRESLGLAMMAAALFWPAGTLNWPGGWGALLATAVWTAGMAAMILRFNPALLAERLGPRKGAFGWDTAILGALGILQLGRYILAGFDRRFNGPGDFSPAVQIIALLVCMLGYGLMVWATAVNAFFSQVVRIQTERGHTVVSAGPYHFIRHPAYSGAILYELAVPFLLASEWALGISAITVGLLVLRTALEDRTLRTGLAGYSDYTRQVRYRLLPGVW